MIRTLGAALLVAGSLAAALVAPTAGATPGQCWNSPFGGFCDSMPMQDGSFMHCESVGFGSSLYQNCYQACLDEVGRLLPTDYNYDTPC